MVEMEDIIAIKEYLKKLQKVINFDNVFSFANLRLVKKSRIDDIICCIYAKLPDSYKKVLKSKVNVKQYNSILCYGLLTKLLAKKFFLDQSLCLLDISEVNRLTNSVISGIERDIYNIEKLFEGHGN